MSEPTARYSCDACRSRKIGCSRETAGCRRCQRDRIACTYSRAGVIRRTRRPKKEDGSSAGYPSPPPSESPVPTLPNPIKSHRSQPSLDGPQSHLAWDIEATRERLSDLDCNQQNSLGALSSLSEACASVWHDALGFDQSSGTQSYFLFPEHEDAWVDVFVHALDRGRPLLSPAPANVLVHLRSSRPHMVHERAWLVMYYSMVLSIVSSTDPNNQDIKAKLRCNLWLAVNDVRLLLEPSEANIQALVMLATHVEEFTTPSLCWMLVTTACRMLQALGVSRRLKPHIRERRTMMFWHLNLLDKGLALVFGRPPTFHLAMARELRLPKLEDLLPMKPHLTPECANVPSSFGMHFFYHMMLLTRIIGDIWYCLYEEETPNESRIDTVSFELEAWYQQARTVLEAAATAEKPFLDAPSMTSIELGLTMLHFQYQHMHLLLARGSPRMKPQCRKISKKMLCLLDNMVSDSQEPYNGIVWQLICVPFTPFLVLFGEIIASKPGDTEDNREALSAMERLPTYLRNMGTRNSLAAKLDRIASVLAQHARSIVYPQDQQPAGATSTNGICTKEWPFASSTADWDMFLNQAMTEGPLTGNLNATPDELAMWANDFGNDMFDWIGWDSQI